MGKPTPEKLGSLMPSGGLYHASETGELPRIGAAPKPPWDAHADDIVSQVRAQLGQDVVSVALRGATVHSARVDSIAEADVVIFHNDADSERPKVSIPSEPAVKVYVAMIPEREFPTNDRWAHTRFSLAFCGWTVWGRDLLGSLPPPMLGDYAEAHLSSLAKWLFGWQRQFVRTETDQDRKWICIWFSRRCIRAMFESVMLERRVFSQDIYYCAKVAAEEYPAYADRIVAIAETAMSPTADVDVFHQVSKAMVEPLYEAHCLYYARKLDPERFDLDWMRKVRGLG